MHHINLQQHYCYFPCFHLFLLVLFRLSAAKQPVDAGRTPKSKFALVQVQSQYRAPT